MTRRCTILLFAQLAEQLNSRSIDIELDEGATVRDLIETLCRTHPALTPWRESLAVAINERYAARETVIESGQMIALIPPVSGG